MQNAAVEIGRIIREARLDSGFKSRASLVETRPLKGKITQEGLRKIEQGERIPRLENLHLICSKLNLTRKAVKKLETMALEKTIERTVRRAGNATVTFTLDGQPVRVQALPPERKVEAFVRKAVEKLVEVVDKYGVMEEDKTHFRRHARNILLHQLA